MSSTGAPVEDIDYTVQPMGRASFGSNMLIASTWRHAQEMRRIGRPDVARRWDLLPQNPALAYDAAQNRLIVTAAVLQAPVLDMATDGASHYGTFGALVGHELSRAVDVRGTPVSYWVSACMATCVVSVVCMPIAILRRGMC